MAATRDVSGERRVAFVPWGLARRAIERAFGLGVVAFSVVEVLEAFGVVTPLGTAGSAMSLTALGVCCGVRGGWLDFFVRLLGVDGAGAADSASSAGGEAAFLLRGSICGTGGGGIG